MTNDEDDDMCSICGNHEEKLDVLPNGEKICYHCSEVEAIKNDQEE